MKLSFHPAGTHHLQIPGPSPVPHDVLGAIAQPTIDHRGPEFPHMGKSVLSRLGAIFQTSDPVVIYPSSGTGAWEAALVNTMSPGDTVLMYETGHFASLWKAMAGRLGLKPEFVSLPGVDSHTGIPNSWRHGASAALIGERLAKDVSHAIKAVCVVHNETSTGVTSDIAAIRAAIDACGHPALLMVDTISGLAAADYRHGEWGVDVSISGSQKGLMLPPGMGFNAVSAKAMEASRRATLPKAYWAWEDIVEMNRDGYWPYTPNTNLLYGLSRSLDILLQEGMPQVFARHQRLAAACRVAVQGWGLDIVCADAALHSPVLTGVVMPRGVDADAVRKVIYEHFNTSLGTGLGKVKGRIFRIGHLGVCDDVSLVGALSACEMGLRLAGVHLQGQGVQAAMDYLVETSVPAVRYP